MLAMVVSAVVLASVGADPKDDPPVYEPPASQPANGDRPPNPFGPRTFDRKDAIPGTIELSNGELAVGRIYTTRDKPLRLYETRLKRFLPIPLRSIKTITGHLEWAREEPQWRWQEMGSDDKVYSGLSYPVLKVYYTLTLLDGRQYIGHCQTQPLYVTRGKERARYILWQRHKGELGQILADLRYVKAVHFGEAAMQRGLETLRCSAASKRSRRTPRAAPGNRKANRRAIGRRSSSATRRRESSTATPAAAPPRSPCPSASSDSRTPSTPTTRSARSASRNRTEHPPAGRPHAPNPPSRPAVGSWNSPGNGSHYR